MLETKGHFLKKKKRGKKSELRYTPTPTPHNGVNTISEVSKKETVKNLKPLLIDTNIPKDHRIMDFSEFLRLEMDFMPKLSVKVSEIGPKKTKK